MMHSSLAISICAGRREPFLQGRYSIVKKLSLMLMAFYFLLGFFELSFAGAVGPGTVLFFMTLGTAAGQLSPSVVRRVRFVRTVSASFQGEASRGDASAGLMNKKIP